MSKQLSTSVLTHRIPSNIATGDEVRRLLKMIAGYLFVSASPKRMADGVFDRLVRSRQTKSSDRLDNELIVEGMKVLLDGHYSNQDIWAFAKQFHERRMEDRWGRWQASHKANWNVNTEVMGLEHFTAATELGRGEE